MEINKLISLKPHRNYKALIFSLVVLTLNVFLYILMIKQSVNKPGQLLNNSKHFEILFLGFWFLTIISIVWSYKIAKQTGREPGIWVIIGLFAGAFGLLIISLKDYKIKNETLLKIIKKTRKEYQNELKKKGNNNPEYKSELEQKYNQILIDRTAEVLTKEKMEIVKELVDRGVISKETDLKEKERVIKRIEQNKIQDKELLEWNPDWVENERLCPACGTTIDSNSDYCLNCGLKLK